MDITVLIVKVSVRKCLDIRLVRSHDKSGLLRRQRFNFQFNTNLVVLYGWEDPSYLLIYFLLNLYRQHST